MKKVFSYLKKTLKVAMWLMISLVLIFIITAVLIQVPAVQNKIVHAATSFVSNKTHTRVEIKNVSISFPKSIVLEGLYLEDLNKDTLIYADKVKINIVLHDLIANKITINSLALKKVHLNFYNIKTDSLFNYNFLLTAFADTTQQTTDDAKKSVAWTFSIDQVSLKQIRLRYDDEFGGMKATAQLGNADIKMNTLDMVNSVYKLDNLLIEQLKANVQTTGLANTKEEESIGILPSITASNIRINNSTLTYSDAASKQKVLAAIHRFELKNGNVDLENEIVSLDKIYLSKSDVRYFTADVESVVDTTLQVPEIAENAWKVTVKEIEFNDNSITYKAGNKPTLKNVFDTDFIKFQRLNLLAEDIFYSSEFTRVKVKQLSAVDQNNFAITKFETEFSMDKKSITAKNVKAGTSNSSLEGNFNLQYPSLQSLTTSLALLKLNINLKNANFKNADLLYFSPQLKELEFFNSKTNTTFISGQINGRINHLKGKNIIVRTGKKTMLSTYFSMVGLPEFRTAYFVFPNMKLVSGRQDIEMMAEKSIPSSVQIPEDIILLINFKGKMNAFETTMNASSTFGGAKVLATIDENENFRADLDILDFDMGQLLKNNKMYGPTSLTALVSGQGLNTKTMKAKISADVSQIYLNEYLYHNLTLDGTANGQAYVGRVNLKDKNAIIALDGLVNMTPREEKYKFHLNVEGIDLQKLKFTERDIRVAMDATADMEGGTLNTMNGTAGINNLVLTHNGKKYQLDSVMLASVNRVDKSDFDFRSALMGLRFNGNISPTTLPTVLTAFLNNYFPFSTDKAQVIAGDTSKFNFKIQLHNHPILSEVFLPELKEFDPGLITGSFDNQKKQLKFNAIMKHILYGTTEINDMELDVSSDSTALNYKLSGAGVSMAQINFESPLLKGKIADEKITANLSSIDKDANKKLQILAAIRKEKTNYLLKFDPEGFYLMNKRWDIAADNAIEIGESGFMIHHLFMNNDKSHVNIASVNNKMNDDVNINIKNFKLEDISQIIEKDSSLLKGDVNGNVLLKRVNNAYGIVADAGIDNLYVLNKPIGNLALNAQNPTAKRFDMLATLSGADNQLNAKGFFVPNGGDNSLNIDADIQSLSMKTVEAFSMGQISEASGFVNGNFSITGSTAIPEIKGALTFNNAFMKPAYLNNRLKLKHETVELKTDGIYLNNFALLDVNQHKATIDGVVKMKQFSEFNLGLKVKTKDFLLFNTTVKDNKEFFGRMIIDSDIDIKGPMSLPVLNARLKMKKGSNFTFAVPEDELTTDKGEDVVEFNSTQNLNSILYRTDKKVIKKTGITGFDLSSIIEVDKEATLRLLMDPAASDSLVVRGEAALSFTMDRSGKMSLTGAYNLNDGSYLVSLESVIKRKFDIKPGSTIIWNGDPLDAAINIDAIYSVRAAPFDLMSDQIEGLSEAEKGSYKQVHPFMVILKLRGAIMKPEINFEIQLAPEDKGILNGAVNQKLTLLNEDLSLLNKQVFALLVLGRFVQENPLQTASGGTSSLIRSTVSNFLSVQLNQLSSKLVKGVELNFDIQSYDDYQSGQAQGRTKVEIGLKKELFNDRLSVEIGGAVDVEGEAAKQNSASDITGDVKVEYKLSKDGRYRLKGFRHNQYEGAIDGQLVQTGVGIALVRDFNYWRNFLKTRKDSSTPRDVNKKQPKSPTKENKNLH